MSKLFPGWENFKEGTSTTGSGTPLLAKKKSKYGNKKITINGIDFDSKREGRRFLELRMMQEAGLITNLRLQREYLLVVNNVLVCKYIADFTYHEGQNYIVEDCKGFKTEVYKLKKKLMQAIHGIIIKET